jgi:hypothetical protein
MIKEMDESEKPVRTPESLPDVVPKAEAAPKKVFSFNPLGDKKPEKKVEQMKEIIEPEKVIQVLNLDGQDSDDSIEFTMIGAGKANLKGKTAMAITPKGQGIKNS